ncbi:hypothetical protein QBC37DRAFT_478619 [Rhypophila decipiens]|uniref:Rhodopsin domain-containing protein n=1 Tax=Rhypophila decipiens TaxID=261697 RepID=A0AAN6YIW5_9PEZI|nr:hypothetical protein QBC37DRAFT_478619 [Rhypophila decipiens]
MSSLRPKPYSDYKYKHLLRSTGFLLLLCATTTLAADPPRCYSTAGNLIKDKNVVPCNPNATASGEPGSHSSCCNQQMGDVCLSTGLCLNTGSKGPSGLLWLNGCTDPTWRDRACPQYCNPPVGSTRDVWNPTLRACTAKSWCCAGYYDSDEDCCANDFNMTSRGAGRIERIMIPDDALVSETSSVAIIPTSTPSDLPGNNNDPSSCSTDSNANTDNKNEQNGSSTAGNGNPTTTTTTAAITGGILGTLLLAALIALVLIFLQNRKLRRSLAAAEEARKPTAASANGDDPYKEQYYQRYPSEVAHPNYGLSPPAWVPTELAVNIKAYIREGCGDHVMASAPPWDSLPTDVQQELLDGPALAPPPGVVVNPIAIDQMAGNRAAIRVYLEDVIGLVALAFYFASLWGFAAYAEHPGYFVHAYQLRVRDMEPTFFALWYVFVTYLFLLVFGKTAILLEWVRIFVPAGTRPLFWWLAHALIAINIISGTIIAFFTIFDCSPVDKFWKGWIDGSCFYYLPIDLVSVSLNLAVDILAMIIPQKIIWGMVLLGRAKKVGLSIVFGLGILTCICAIGRLKSAIDSFVPDMVYFLGPAMLWVLAEQTCIMLVFLVPGAAPVFHVHKLPGSGPFIRVGRFFRRQLLRLSSWSSSSTGGRSATSDGIQEDGGRTATHNGNALDNEGIDVEKTMDLEHVINKVNVTRTTESTQASVRKDLSFEQQKD